MRGYVDSKGRVFGRSRWAKPVEGAPITSRFNPRRLHPILKVVKPHNGTDFGAPSGTPVLAAATGKVSFLGEAGPNGNLITLEHAGGYQTGYSHLSRFARGLRAGDSVRQKQVIGYVGTTGRSTGPHLHLSAKKNGRFIDPESLELGAFSRLPLEDRQLLSRLRERYDQLLDELKLPDPPPSREVESAVVALTPADDDLTGAEGEDTEPATSATATASVAPSAVAVARGAPARAAVAARPPPAAPSLSIYVTDVELMRRQPDVHAGEVAP
jgi:hypothetical protein